MAVQMYEVISDKYVGKHKVYVRGAQIQESEITGGEEGKKLALEGQKGAKNKRGQALPDVPVKLKKVINSTKKASK